MPESLKANVLPVNQSTEEDTVNIQKLSDAPVNHRGGQVSHLLLTDGQFGTSHLSVTWVEGGPGSEQQIHQHDDAEQAYVIVRGTGSMRVGAEEQEVSEGTLVLVPRRTGHAIRNAGDAPLVFVSVTSPPFDIDALPEVFRYRSRI
jgi:mannose-6-phosphate isomerase-like protein (cupin superfamily)